MKKEYLIAISIVSLIVVGSLVGYLLFNNQSDDSKDLADVTYNYSIITSDEIKLNIHIGSTTTNIVEADPGYTFIILKVKVHNEASNAIYVSLDSFYWSSSGVRIEFAWNHGFDYWYYFNPDQYHTSGYVQTGTTWTYEIIYHVQDFLSTGKLMPYDVSWNRDLSL